MANQMALTTIIIPVGGNYLMKFILLTDMSILMTVISDIIILIFTYHGLTYHIECTMAVLKYLPFTATSSDSMTFP